jgi:hypothetical protein
MRLKGSATRANRPARETPHHCDAIRHTGTETVALHSELGRIHPDKAAHPPEPEADVNTTAIEGIAIQLHQHVVARDASTRVKPHRSLVGTFEARAHELPVHADGRPSAELTNRCDFGRLFYCNIGVANRLPRGASQKSPGTILKLLRRFTIFRHAI